MFEQSPGSWRTKWSKICIVRQQNRGASIFANRGKLRFSADFSIFSTSSENPTEGRKSPAAGLLSPRYCAISDCAMSTPRSDSFRCGDAHISCGSNGYLHPRYCFLCVCPQGFTGPTCEGLAPDDLDAPPNCGSAVQVVFVVDCLPQSLFLFLGNSELANTQRRSLGVRRNVCWTADLLLLPHKGWPTFAAFFSYFYVNSCLCCFCFPVNEFSLIQCSGSVFRRPWART